MTTPLWILSGILAFAFGMAGVMKNLKSKEELIPMGMGWAEDFSQGQVRIIGGLELLGAVGLILPVALGIAPKLAGAAAAGLLLTMLGAAAVHAKRGEFPMIGINVVLGGLAGYVAYSHLM